MRKQKSNKGITLIALIITIIVMLILVSVTITISVNSGLFGYAQNVARQTNEAMKLEQELGSGKIKIGGKWYKSIDAYLANKPIDQDIIIDETLEENKFTLEIEDGYNPETGVAVTKQLTPTLIGIEGDATWTSSNKTVADVDETGLVTAIGVGETKITVSVTYRGDTFTDTCIVIVEMKIPTISKEQAYVGCYADFEGDGIIDGIIYADLAIGNTYKETLNNDNAYTIPVETDKSKLKEYYISETGVVGTFGKEPRKIIKPANNDKTKKDRFYVMDLTDFTRGTYTTFYWDKNGRSIDYGTSTNFEAGKTNTELLINYWKDDNNTTWATQDIWYNLPMDSRWFVPSSEELSAFLHELGITSKTRATLGLKETYWSSSQRWWSLNSAWDAYNGNMTWWEVDETDYVRLSTTF